METTPTQHMTLIVLSGALVAALVAALVIYFFPKNMTSPQALQDSSGQAVQGGNLATEFNTAVLQRAEYRELDASLFVRGLLPVVPPTGTGKTNLFQ